MITGAALLLAGIVIGRFLPERRRTKKAQKAMKAICGCDHSIGYHKNKTGYCQGRVGWDAVPCTCQHYDGPIPVESMFSTPLLPPSET